MSQLTKKIEKQLALIQGLQVLENALSGLLRPPYTWKGQILDWGEDMPKGFRATMFEEAEVAVLLDASGEPTKLLFVDAYNTLREGAIC